MHTLCTHNTSDVVRLVFVKETREHIAKIMKSGAAQEIITRSVADASAYSDHIPVQTISMTLQNQEWM
jgi:hypothetical protein